MKVKVSDPKQSKDKPLPKLMRSKASGTIILASDYLGDQNIVGTVVFNNGAYDVGYYGKDWSTDNFEDFHGTVTLEND